MELQLFCLPVKMRHKTVDQAKICPMSKKKIMVVVEGHKKEYFLYASSRDKNLINRTKLRKSVFCCNIFFSFEKDPFRLWKSLSR